LRTSMIRFIASVPATDTTSFRSAPTNPGVIYGHG
jgi:hypothetical protein